MEYVEIFSCLFYTLFICHVVVYVCSRDLCLQDADIKTSSVGLLALYCKQVPHTHTRRVCVFSHKAPALVMNLYTPVSSRFQSAASVCVGR